uniref:Uncharacterized protein n=1 Tax=Setaria viridis TaxID=4556 RepID=A0A4U6URX5_SETVI|nr:hypothetical protein SEVIR_5G121650v2 [Setaria viridis]
MCNSSSKIRKSSTRSCNSASRSNSSVMKTLTLAQELSMVQLLLLIHQRDNMLQRQVFYVQRYMRIERKLLLRGTFQMRLQ